MIEKLTETYSDRWYSLFVNLECSLNPIFFVVVSNDEKGQANREGTKAKVTSRRGDGGVGT